MSRHGSSASVVTTRAPQMGSRMPLTNSLNKALASGRPLVDRIQGSQFHNMKELRPPSTGSSEIRMLFAFDPAREAIFLVAGDKAGNWSRWYRQAIPVADERYTEHLISLKEDES